MNNIKVDISKLKTIIAKINVAIEKTKLNPKSGWIELESISSDIMTIKVANFDYYIEAEVPISCDYYSNDNKIHATVTAETFIPLISKLDDTCLEISERLNSLILSTEKSEYTFPIIKEAGKVKPVDAILFNCNCIETVLNGSDLASITSTNTKGLLDSIFAKDIQQFIYVDNTGAITFTENIYINDFCHPSNDNFKFLLNSTQSKLLKVLDSFDNVSVRVEVPRSYESSFKVNLIAKSDYKLFITFIVQSQQVTDKFPSIKLRSLASAVSNTHIILDKKKLEKALQRLMVFDKKWDITEMAYSKLVFDENSVKLVSIKNKNYEVLEYKSSTNALKHEAIIRFADLINQLKAAQGKEVDISYGDSPAIVINSYGLKQLIPEIQVVGRV